MQPSTPTTRPSESGVPLVSVAASAPLRSTMPPLSFDRFEPLLASSELSGVRQSLEQNDTRAAVRQLRALLSGPVRDESVRPGWAYLCGVLEERMGATAAAGQSYQAAMVDGFMLRGYAALAAARISLAAGRSAETLTLLEQVASDPATWGDVLLLRAQALAQQGKNSEAVQTLTAGLATNVAPSVRPVLGVSLAELLIVHEPGPVVVSRESLAMAMKLAEEAVQAPGGPADLRKRARAVQVQIFSLLSPSEAQKMVPGYQEVRVEEAEELADMRDFQSATALAQEVLDEFLAVDQVRTLLGCRATMVVARAAAARRDVATAVPLLDRIVRECPDSDIMARALFLGGGQLSRRGDNADALLRYAALEDRFPNHRLADDARLKRALLYAELGVEARTTELLSGMADDYPLGDMTRDGLFELALRSLVRRDWSGAAAVLERLERLPLLGDTPRSTRDRERYFLARTRIELGQREAGIVGLEALVRECPLSYYMLNAFSWLTELDPGRAKAALLAGLERARSGPFDVPRRPEMDRPGFARALALLALGDQRAGERELSLLGMGDNVAPEISWIMASLFVRADAPKSALALVKRHPNDWPDRWPVDSWGRAWEIAFPRPYATIVTREAAQSGLEEALVYAIMREESEFDPDVTSWADAHGLMQLIVPTARSAAQGTGLPSSAEALKRPSVNIALGCRVLKGLMKQFDAELVMVIAGYNAGPGRPRRWKKERPILPLDIWVEAIPFSETRGYVKRVLASRAAYRWLYDPETREASPGLPLRLNPN